MYIVVVDIQIAKGGRAAFMSHMRRQAERSLSVEEGCRKFDICVAEGDPDSILLYEVYDDAAAFEDHLATPHFTEFDAAVGPLMASKSVRIFQMA